MHFVEPCPVTSTARQIDRERSRVEAIDHRLPAARRMIGSVDQDEHRASHGRTKPPTPATRSGRPGSMPFQDRLGPRGDSNSSCRHVRRPPLVPASAAEQDFRDFRRRLVSPGDGPLSRVRDHTVTTVDAPPAPTPWPRGPFGLSGRPDRRVFVPGREAAPRSEALRALTRGVSGTAVLLRQCRERAERR